MRPPNQSKLFDTSAQLPNGLLYRSDFITLEEEEVLLAYLGNAPLQNATHTVHTSLEDIEIEAKRRHMGFGWGWDYRNKLLVPGEPLPRFLQPLQRKIAKWLDITPGRVAEALINEYTSDTSLGWHVDNEGFEQIVGISLGGWARMRFRPLKRKSERNNAADVVTVELEPRSAYVMQGPVRWQWQHSVASVPALRYSITFRTLPKQLVRKK